MRLVVVEDSMEVRNRLIALLQSCQDIDIVGQAATESDAIRLIDQSAPDTILLDINLAMGNGVRVLESIRRRGNAAYVIMMTALSHEAYRELCLRLGANEFRDKTQGFDDLQQSLFARAVDSAKDRVKTVPSPADSTRMKGLRQELRFDCMTVAAARHPRKTASDTPHTESMEQSQ